MVLLPMEVVVEELEMRGVDKPLQLLIYPDVMEDQVVEVLVKVEMDPEVQVFLVKEMMVIKDLRVLEEVVGELALRVLLLQLFLDRGMGVMVYYILSLDILDITEVEVVEALKMLS